MAERQARRKNGGNPNGLFYFAPPSLLARPIIEGLGAAVLAENDPGGTRIVIEKPFGHDIQSGTELNRTVNDVFDEDALARDDHNPEKETVQSILVEETRAMRDMVTNHLLPNAYATRLLDVIHGDPTRFPRRDEVDAEWRSISPIEETWAAQAATLFPSYAAGSDGPGDANARVERDGHSWGVFVSQLAAIPGIA